MENLTDFWASLDSRLVYFALTGLVAALLAGNLYQDRNMPKWMIACHIVGFGLMAAAGFSLFFPPMMPYTQYMRLTSYSITALVILIEGRMNIPPKGATDVEIEDARKQKRTALLIIAGVFVVGMLAFPFIAVLDKQEAGQAEQSRNNRTLNRNTGILLDIFDFIKDFRAKSERTDSLQQAQINLIFQQMKQFKQTPIQPGGRGVKRVSYTATPIPPLTPVDSVMPVNLAEYVAVRVP